MKSTLIYLIWLLSGYLLLSPCHAQSVVPLSPSQSTYELNKSPYTVENLGNFVQSSTPNASVTFIHPSTKQMHFIQTYYLTSKIATTPFQILDLNLDTGQTHIVDGALGVPSQLLLYPGTGMVYITSYSPDFLTQYDVVTGQARVVHAFADGAQSVGLGDDLNIYFGQAIKGYLERYDPRKDPEGLGVAASWTNYGIVADPGPPYYRYIYSVYSDGKFAYMAIRDQNSPTLWSFVVKNLSTLEERVFLKDINPIIIESLTTRRGYGVGCYTLSSGKSCFRYDGFTLVGAIDPNNLPGTPVTINLPEGTNLSTTGYQMDLADKVADSSTNGAATLRWKKPGESTWRSITVPGIRLEPVPIRQIEPYSATQLIGFPVGYGPTFLIDGNKKSATMYGRALISLYHASFSQKYQRWYFAGYPSAWEELDPNKAWTLSYVADSYNTATNPHMMPRPTENEAHMMAKYYRFIAEDIQGFVYLGGSHERDSVGASLMWYKPSTLPTGSITPSWAAPWIGQNYGVLRTTFENSSISGLAPSSDGTKMIISTRLCCGATDVGKIYVMDTATKLIEKSWSPLSLNDPGYIVTAPTDDIIAAGENSLYRLNTKTGTILYSIATPGVLNGRTRFGPDGYLWGFWGNSLYRVHPDSGGMQKVLDATPGPFTFFNQDFYFTNGAMTNRILNLLKPKSAPKSPINLRIQ